MQLCYQHFMINLHHDILGASPIGRCPRLRDWDHPRQHAAGRCLPSCVVALTCPPLQLARADKPVLVVILDGFGENDVKDEFNAVSAANTPCYDKLRAQAPDRFRTVRAHGTAVGLPSDADMGNSEVRCPCRALGPSGGPVTSVLLLPLAQVGHNALGAGQVIDQGARLVDNALESKKMFEGDGFKYISESFASHTVHFIGLLSDGGVHSRFDQIVKTMTGSVERGAKRIRMHILTDGRDVPDGSSIHFIEDLEKVCRDLEAKHGADVKIASGGGRMYVTMDRYESDWNIVERGWKAHVLGEAPNKFKDALTAVKTLRG